MRHDASRLERSRRGGSNGPTFWVQVPGGCGLVEHDNGTVYLARALRNVGPGTGCATWVAGARRVTVGRGPTPGAGLAAPLVCDIYVAPGDTGFWHGALRDPSEPISGELVRAVEEGTDGLTIDLQYGDDEGGQRVISRFAFTPREGEDGATRWLASTARHWNLDRADPR